MDPVTALGLASNVVQFVDFTGKLISQSYEIYKSASGTTEENVVLEEVAKNLAALASILQVRPRELEKSTSWLVRRRDRTETGKTLDKAAERAEMELQQICEECKTVTEQLLNELERIKVQGRYRKWKSFRQALSTVWSQDQISALQKRLDGISTQLNTTLLVTLRARFDQDKKGDSAEGSAGRWLNSEVTQFIAESREWHEKLLDAIYKNNWQVNNLQDMSMFSAQLEKSVENDKEAQFHQMILSALEYSGMPDREERISKAHRDTFEWIFDDSHDSTTGWEDFVDWLKCGNDSGIYWITGKAGSGKSTLMKHLYEDPRTMKHLMVWSGQSPLIIAGFFFWNSGTAMQMSQMGLIQTLLHQVLKACPDLTIKLFEDRWRKYNPVRGSLIRWTWPALAKAFNALINDTSKRFFFFIDGLDECDGDHNNLVDLILQTTKSPNVKICAASRPWLVFEDAFESRPSLQLEQLTYRDIQLYVSNKFESNKRYLVLLAGEPEYARSLVNSVVEKAHGVFLWVYLVVDSLLQGITNSDRVSDLQRRLDSLPTDLEDLFDKILNSLDNFYFQHACQYIQIIKAAEEPLTLLAFSFADDEDATSALTAEIRPLSDDKKEHYEQEMRRRLKSRCKGLIEAPSWGSKVPRVEFLHRTVKDYVEGPQIWLRISSATEASFDPFHSLANSFLRQLKGLDPQQEPLESYWRIVAWCMEYATSVQMRTGETQEVYLDNVFHVGMCNYYMFDSGRLRLWNHWSGYLVEPRRGNIESIYQLAILCGLFDYVKTKLGREPRPLNQEDLSKLLEYALGPKDASRSRRSPFTGMQILGGELFPSIDMIKYLLERGADPTLHWDKKTLRSDIFEPAVQDLLQPYTKHWWSRKRGAPSKT